MLVLQVIRLAAFGDINTSTQAKSYARSLTAFWGAPFQDTRRYESMHQVVLEVYPLHSA